MPPGKAAATAADILGGQTSLAKALHCSQSIVSLWISQTRKPSAKFAKEIERLTGGQIKREWLRPDIFG